MRWFKKKVWKAGIALAGILLFLVLMVWVPMSAADAYERSSELARPVTGTVQVTPTPKPTQVTPATDDLAKEKLIREIEDLRNRNFWAWTALGTILIGVAGFAAAVVSVGTWSLNRLGERKKQAEDRFQKVVEGLGGGNKEAKVGAAIVLRTFLDPKYKQFHKQAFDLAVAHLRLRPSEEKGHGLIHHKDPPSAEPSSLRQALISIFIEALPGARGEVRKRQEKEKLRKESGITPQAPTGSSPSFPLPESSQEKEELFDPRSLNATHIYLDNAYLWKSNLQQIWLGWASLQKTNLCQAELMGTWLWHADLRGANLSGADLRRVDLGEADLSGARLDEAILYGATLWGADLRGTDLRGAKLGKATSKEAMFLLTQARRDSQDKEATTLLLAKLCGADLCEAHLEGATLSLADLREADLRGADLRGADLRGAKLDNVQHLNEAKLGEVLLSGPHPNQVRRTKNAIHEIEITFLPKLNEDKISKAGYDKVDLDTLYKETISWDELMWALSKFFR